MIFFHEFAFLFFYIGAGSPRLAWFLDLVRVWKKREIFFSKFFRIDIEIVSNTRSDQFYNLKFQKSLFFKNLDQ